MKAYYAKESYCFLNQGDTVLVKVQAGAWYEYQPDEQWDEEQWVRLDWGALSALGPQMGKNVKRISAQKFKSITGKKLSNVCSVLKDLERRAIGMTMVRWEEQMKGCHRKIKALEQKLKTLEEK